MNINREVAEKVLKLLWGADEIWWSIDYVHAKRNSEFVYEGHCDDWNFGGLVVKRMRELAWVISINAQPIPNGLQCFQVRFTATDGLAIYIDDTAVDFADTAPLAICKAALKALT